MPQYLFEAFIELLPRNDYVVIPRIPRFISFRVPVGYCCEFGLRATDNEVIPPGWTNYKYKTINTHVVHEFIDSGKRLDNSVCDQMAHRCVHYYR